MEQATLKAQIMDATAMDRALTRIAHEILEHNEGAKGIALVGVLRRGVPLAERLAEKIAKIEREAPRIGKLDISFYRDDYARHITAVRHATDIMFPIDGVDVILDAGTARVYVEGWNYGITAMTVTDGETVYRYTVVVADDGGTGESRIDPYE